MKNLKMRNNGFTLVELIIVILVLLILGTIGIVSYFTETKEARDSLRKSDLDSINKVLSLEKSRTGELPMPLDYAEYVDLDGNKWYSGKLGSGMLEKLDVLSGIPIDPKSGENYIYELSFDKRSYKLKTNLEYTGEEYVLSNISSSGEITGGNSGYVVLNDNSENTTYCDIGQHLEGSVCVNNTRIVPIENGLCEDKFVSGSWIGCNTIETVTCNIGYILIGSKCEKISYSWDIEEWSVCLVIAGNGNKTRGVTCKRNDGLIVDDLNCPLPKPDKIQECFIYSWNDVEDWSSVVCSLDNGVCGAGTKTRLVQCIENYSKVVADEKCNNYPDAGDKPDSSQACNGDACVYSWDESEWGSCSKEVCGGGTQIRTVECKRENDNTIVEDSLCSSPKPAISQACNTANCTYAWTAGAWGACSLTNGVCGGGTQTRTVNCVRTNDNKIVTDSLCSSTKPSTSQACTGVACTYAWATGAWGACNKSCGGGTMYRSVWCKRGNDGNAVADSYCGGGKPATSSSCNTHACPYCVDRVNTNRAVSCSTVCSWSGERCHQGATDVKCDRPYTWPTIYDCDFSRPGQVMADGRYCNVTYWRAVCKCCNY